jgi:uncharacterized protein (TIGR00369 family)
MEDAVAEDLDLETPHAHGGQYEEVDAVPIVARERPRGDLWGPEVLERTGLEMMRASIDQVLPDPPLTRLTGLRLTEIGLGVASAAMPASPWWQSGAGVFLAGTIAFVADLPLASAALSTAPAGTIVTSSELSVSFVRPATIRSRSLIGRARLIHSTKSLGLAEGTIEDAQGRLLGHATSRCLLFHAEAGSLHPLPAGGPPSSALPDPHLREVEGVVLGQDYWDSTSGIDFVRQVVGGHLHPPLFTLFGIRAPEGGEGDVSVTMPSSGWLCNAFGVLYGGALAMLADCAMTMSVASTVPAATAYSPLDMKIYYLRPARPDGRDLTARARVTHRGRTIAVVTCEIVDVDGRVMAQASGSVLILPGRPWERPVHVADEFTQDIDRVLATILFIDLVDSTGHAARLGDNRWKQLLQSYHAAAREEVQRFRGTEIDDAGDGFLMSFDGAARAVRCAAAIRARARALGLEVRAGVHTGECEMSGKKLVGMTVHAGARIAGVAGPGEILTSSIVRDLATSAGLSFQERGVRSLKGVPGEWPLYAATVG